MSRPDNWRFERGDILILGILLLLVLWTFRGIIGGSHEPFMSSLRDFEPWRSELPAEDWSRPESFADDPTTQTYPWAIYAHENLQNGDFPLWNTRMFSGTPFTANRLTGLFNPLVLIPVWLLPPIAALTVFYFIHYLAAAWFMYLFLKSLRVSRPAATFGAISFIFMGAYIPWMGFIVADKCYIVMSMYYLHRACTFRDIKGITGFIISFTLLTLASYPQMVVFGIYIFAAWVLFAYKGGMKKSVLRLSALAAMLVLVFLLGGMQNLPTIEFFNESIRAQPEFDIELQSLTELEQHTSPAYLLAIFFPTLWGDYLVDPVSPLPEYVLGIYNHTYIGILAAFGFLFFPIVWRNRKVKFFTIAAIFGLLCLAFHDFYMFIAKILPGFRISTVKPDFLTLTFMIIVASFVLDHLLTRLKTDPEFTAKFNRVFGVLLALMFLIGAAFVFIRIQPSVLPIGLSIVILTAFGHLIFVWVAAILMYLYTKKRLSVAALSTVIVVLAIIDLVPYHEHFMPLVPKGKVCFETGSIEFLKERNQNDGPFRVFRDRSNTLAPNSLMIYGLDEPGGFDSFVSSDYAHFFRSIDPSMSRNSRTLDLPSEPINYSKPFWNFLGIRYLLFPEKNNSLPPPWELRWTGDLFIYENTEWMPRWFTVPNIIPVDSIENGYNASQAIDPIKEAVVVGIEHTDIPPALLESSTNDTNGRHIETIEYSADELRLRTSSDRDQFLIFSDTYFPGWRAWIDRNEVEIYRTNGIVKGIVIPSGEHEIRFLYDPLSYKIGWLLVLIGLILTPFSIKPIRQLLALPAINPSSNLL